MVIQRRIMHMSWRFASSRALTARRLSLSVTLSLLWLAAAVLPAAAQADAEDLDSAQEKALTAAVQKVSPSVVQIETSGGNEFIRGTQVRKGLGPTTGLIVAADGYIISSSFNFANKPSGIFVAVLGHEQRYVAKVVATDQTR